MNRYKLTIDGKEYKPLIYADSSEEASKYFKDEKILEVTLYDNYDYLEDIDFLKKNSKCIARNTGKNNEIREYYETNFADGKLRFQLSCSVPDEFYFDFALYQFMSKDDLIYPITYTMSNPKDLKDMFFCKDLKYEIYSYRLYGQPKLNKPKELQGVKQSFTVDYILNKCKCQCFIKDNDLWIKHRDFFSASHKPKQEDIGTPITYRLKKYFGTDKKYLDKFVYADNWSDIVLRNEAWIVFRNFKQVLKRNTNPPIQTLREAFLNSRLLKENNIKQLSTDWDRFLEKICKSYFNYVKEVVYK